MGTHFASTVNQGDLLLQLNNDGLVEEHLRCLRWVGTPENQFPPYSSRFVALLVS